jgi:hypothetical protein
LTDATIVPLISNVSEVRTASIIRVQMRRYIPQTAIFVKVTDYLLRVCPLSLPDVSLYAAVYQKFSALVGKLQLDDNFVSNPYGN